MILVLIYIGAVSDVRDLRLDLGEVAGRGTGVELSSLNFSLFCFEFSLIFAAKNYYVAVVKKGFAMLSVSLRYSQQKEGEAFGPRRFFADEDHISTLVPRDFVVLARCKQDCLIGQVITFSFSSESKRSTRSGKEEWGAKNNERNVSNYFRRRNG